MWRHTSFSLIVVLATSTFAHAQDSTQAAGTLEATPADVAASPHAERIEQLIRQLDSSRFVERQAASSELARLGGEAIPALEQAVQDDSREVSTRALDLLKNFMDEGSMETQAAAAAALARIAASDDAIAANEASQALSQASSEGNVPQGNAIAGVPQLVPMPAQGFPIAPGAPLPPGIRINPNRAMIVPNGGIRVQRVIAGGGNGMREITISENGRTVKIHEDANGIQVEVTEPDEQGNDKTETYEAENLEQLKEKHPAAGEIYEEYNQRGQIIIGPAQVPGLPGVAPAPGLQPMLPNDLQIPQLQGDDEAMKLEAQQLQEVIRFFEQFQGEQGVIELDIIDPAAPEADDAGGDE